MDVDSSSSLSVSLPVARALGRGRPWAGGVPGRGVAGEEPVSRFFPFVSVRGHSESRPDHCAHISAGGVTPGVRGDGNKF